MSSDFLKDWLHRNELSQADKLLILLSTFEGPVPLKEIVSRGEAAGVKRKSWANASASLSRLRGLAIHTGAGWEITSSGRQKLTNDGIIEGNQGTINLASDLRRHVSLVTDDEVREYLNETVRCYELGLLRSAVVMAWIAAVYVMQLNILNNHLTAFNAEAARVDSRWKPAKSTDDLGKMKESDFLDRTAAIGLVGKNVKSALKECLDRRNACGHPNSYKIGPNIVAAHIETLVLNVFSRF
ncbi:hypothetical protein Q9K01_03585 [Qipengyuania sp. DY56-A-20]|jgi:hypothetical protein|uniref:DUF4145 domain-containing protein n=1 Tax=Qipengyuania benthica TaxID=3067651 RepID=A0ABT9H5W5_9SPHN|nr:hypothetical protein [Qipengyuania sp. DY56-A-20]MDP4538702.1 hypothetical protein [Qipengyuania sp. DY56-A-20]